jgi:hypothetical protein
MFFLVKPLQDKIEWDSKMYSAKGKFSVLSFRTPIAAVIDKVSNRNLAERRAVWKPYCRGLIFDTHKRGSGTLCVTATQWYFLANSGFDRFDFFSILGFEIDNSWLPSHRM